MIFSSPDPATDPYFATTLLTLQRSAYALEAELVGDHRLPPLLEDEDGLSAWRGKWVTAWDGVDLVGAVAWADHGDHLDIVKIMVSPPVTRQGLGAALLGRVLDASGGRPVVVATGRDNHPARALYVRHGFEPQTDEHVPPGIWLTRFRWVA